MIRASVAMAVYNGEKFLAEQLDSILCQLSDKDELIISYDESKDSTLDIIQDYSSINSQIKIFLNDRLGVVGNFENAIRNSTGEFVVLSDQDDIWLPGKLEASLNSFVNPKVNVVIHDYKLVDESLNEIHPSGFALRWGNGSVIRNIIRLSYIGCCMSFRRSLVHIILPIPTKKRSHDWWIGTVSGMLGKMEVIYEPYLLHRIHNNNATPKQKPPLTYQLGIRALIFCNATIRFFKFKCSGVYK